VLAVLDGHRDVRVVSVEAPGGYGKTTALRQWAESDSRPVVWVTVRPQAPDARWLAQQVVDGLHTAGLLDAPLSLPVASETVAWHLGLLPVVEQAVASASHPFVLVVDEAGALGGPEWESLAASVAAHLPVGSQLVLAARTQAAASLCRLRASGEIATVGPDVLALDLVEGAQLVAMLGLKLDRDALLTLLEETGGWPIAVPLAASVLHSGRRPLAPLVTTDALSDYLRHEVLNPLHPDDARFLLLCSVLPELDEASCDAVSGTTGSLARLRRLAATTRLLAPLDPQGHRFRTHPLLAAFLVEELRTSDPPSCAAAHLAAAAAGERAGDLDVAVFHLRQARDDDRLSRTVWEYTAPLLASGRMPVLRRWIDGLDEQRLRSSPRLALTGAWVSSHEGDMLLMEQRRMAARASAAATDPDLLLDLGLLDATVGSDGIEAMRAACVHYLAAGPPDSPWRTVAHLLEGVAETLQGTPDPAEDTLRRGLHLTYVHEMPVMTAHLLAALADLALLRGDGAAALAPVREARELMDRHRLDFIATTAPVFTTSASVYLLEGRMPQARTEAARALRLTALLRQMAPWYAVQGRLALATVYLGLGEAVRARELLNEAEALRSSASASPVLDQMRQQVRERVDQVAQVAPMGPTLTTAEVRVLQYLPTHLSFPEIARELFVSRHTVKTQVLSAYRKLGAHSRGEAIDRAREIGLLPQL
jgi:LuxR family maltose regulon positive regulatory protein